MAWTSVPANVREVYLVGNPEEEDDRVLVFRLYSGYDDVYYCVFDNSENCAHIDKARGIPKMPARPVKDNPQA